MTLYERTNEQTNERTNEQTNKQTNIRSKRIQAHIGESLIKKAQSGLNALSSDLKSIN